MKKRKRFYTAIVALISLIAGLTALTWDTTYASAYTITPGHEHHCWWRYYHYCHHYPPGMIPKWGTATPSTLTPGPEETATPSTLTPGPEETTTPSTLTPGPGETTPTTTLTPPTPTPPTPTPTPSPPPPTPTPTPTPSPTPIPPPPTQPPATGFTDSPEAAQAVLALLNQERASMNLPALQMSNNLINSAHLHNVTMFQANDLSHQLPNEADLGTRVTAQGIKWRMCAENIGYGYGDATQSAVGLNQSMFDEKPPEDGHRRNILSDATLVGIDVIVNTKNHQVWLTEDFARV